MVEKLFDEVLEQSSISRSLKDSQYQNTILGISRKYLVPLTLLEIRNLDGCHPAGRPTCSPKAGPFITA